jgi:hypothetical protein
MYSNLGSPVINETVPSNPYFPARALLKNKVYYWRVRAEGPNGPSLWSSVWTFKTGNPPSTPVLVSPLNQALLTNYMPTLTWRASTPAAGLAVDNYEVQVGTDANFNDQVYRDYVGNVPTFTFYFALPPNTSYYWRVRALGSNGHYTPWSLTRSFRMSMLAPVLVTVADTNNHRPTFEWQAVDGATSYTIQISISSSFGTFLVNKTVTTLTYIPTANLPHGTIYWRVRANGPNGPSAWRTGNLTILP